MSAVTRAQWRRAWTFVRSSSWSHDIPTTSEIVTRCRFAGVDFLAVMAARAVRAKRGLSDPLTWSRPLRAARRGRYRAAEKAERIGRLAA